MPNVRPHTSPDTFPPVLVVQAVDHVQEGVHQLEETEKIQKNGAPFKCILALIVLIFILVLVNVGKHMPRRRRGVL